MKLKVLDNFFIRTGFWVREFYYLLTRPTTVGTKAIILSDKQEVLLVRHKFGPKKRFWTLPGGGVQVDEHIDQALKREVREETGLKVLDQNLLAIYRQRKRFKSSFSFLFLVKEFSGDLNPNPEFEIEEVKYFASSQLPSDIVPSSQKILEEYLNEFSQKKGWEFFRV